VSPCRLGGDKLYGILNDCKKKKAKLNPLTPQKLAANLQRSICYSIYIGSF